MTRYLNRYDPFAATRWPGLPGMHPLFRPSDTLQTGNWVPALDLTETATHFEVSLELPGLKPDDIEVNYENGTLVIRGEKKSETEAGDGTWRRVERSYGSFSRAVRIGAPVEVEGIQAAFKDGVLQVSVPKAAEARRQQITVQS